MNEKIYLPLRLWILVSGIVFASLFILTQDLQIGLDDNQKSKVLNVSRLQQKTEYPRIIVLGSSLLAFGLPSEETIEEKLKQEGIQSKLDRFIIQGREPDYFTAIFAEILRSKPSIIAIQADLFLLSDNRFFDFRRSESIFQNNILSAYIIATGGSSHLINSSWSHKINTGNYSYPILFSSFLDRFQNRSQNDTDDIIGDSVSLKIDLNNKITSYLPFIKAAQNLGTKVVFVEIGRSKYINNYLGKDAENAMHQSLTNLAVRTNSEIWRFPVTLPVDHYCDLAHFNEKGQKVFTEWFIDRLKQNLK